MEKYHPSFKEKFKASNLYSTKLAFKYKGDFEYLETQESLLYVKPFGRII